jgi:hypothetical protein
MLRGRRPLDVELMLDPAEVPICDVSKAVAAGPNDSGGGPNSDGGFEKVVVGRNT